MKFHFSSDKPQEKSFDVVASIDCEEDGSMFSLLNGQSLLHIDPDGEVWVQVKNLWFKVAKMGFDEDRRLKVEIVSPAVPEDLE